MSAASKILYVLARQLDVFGLPGMRSLRNRIYGRHLGLDGLVVSDRVRIQALHCNPNSSIQIGRDLHVGEGAMIDLSGRLNIGDSVTLSEGAKIFTHDHIIHNNSPNWRDAGVKFSDLEIGDHAWIGAHAIVAPSVRRIGIGAVVAAGAIVTRDVPDMTIVAGVPAKPIGMRG